MAPSILQYLYLFLVYGIQQAIIREKVECLFESLGWIYVGVVMKTNGNSKFISAFSGSMWLQSIIQ